MLEESIDLGEQDLEQRMLIVAGNDAAQLLGALSKQLGEYASLIPADERAQVEKCASSWRKLEMVRIVTYISAIGRRA